MKVTTVAAIIAAVVAGTAGTGNLPYVSAGAGGDIDLQWSVFIVGIFVAFVLVMRAMRL